jgi:hypothetical protein
VPPYLANLVEYLNKDLPSLPQWEQDLIQQLKSSCQNHLKDHFETTAMTRQKFVSMATDLWQDPENHLFSLTEKPRKVLGYLPKTELSNLEELVRIPLTNAVEALRAELEELQDQMRASESDRQEIADTKARTSFFFGDLEQHHLEAEKWRPLAAKKTAIISELEQREEFLEEIEEFENKATGDPDRYKKSNSLALADENKFRAYAAKKLAELDSKAIKLCRQYLADTGRTMEIDGTPYLDMIKEQKFGRGSNPSLSLSKLRPNAIPAAARQKYAGLPPSNLVVDSDSMTKKQSLHDSGEDPRIIRHARKSKEG